MCSCGALWQEILDLETAVNLDQDDRGTLPRTGSIGGVISATPRLRDRLPFELTKRIAFVVNSEGTIEACVVPSRCLKPKVAKTTIPLVVAGVITA